MQDFYNSPWVFLARFCESTSSCSSRLHHIWRHSARTGEQGSRQGTACWARAILDLNLHSHCSSNDCSALSQPLPGHTFPILIRRVPRLRLQTLQSFVHSHSRALSGSRTEKATAQEIGKGRTPSKVTGLYGTVEPFLLPLVARDIFARSSTTLHIQDEWIL